MKLFLTLVLAILVAGAARAGLEIVGPDDKPIDPAQRAREAKDSLDAIAPNLFAAFDLVSHQQQCDPGAASRTHAILVGVSEPLPNRYPALAGPPNDVDVLSKALRAHGLHPDRLHVLLDGEATRTAFGDRLQHVANQAGCTDSVVLFFGGHAVDRENLNLILGDRVPMDPTLTRRSDDTGPFFLLHSERQETISAFSAEALSQAVVLLRNTGADVTVVLDTMHADAARLHARRAQRVPDFPWSQVVTGDPSEAKPIESVLLPNAGDLTALYAVHDGSSSIEEFLPRGEADARAFGVFTFNFASALLADPGLSPRRLARRLEASAQVNDWVISEFRHLLESTAPDSPIVAEARVEPKGDVIRILEPQTTRGAMTLETPAVTLRGQVVWDQPPRVVLVNGREARIEADGGFALDMDIAAGDHRIDIVALTHDNQLHNGSFEVTLADQEPDLLSDGTRYAVLIANQTYGGQTGAAPLETPFADIDAIKAELTERYGFVTQATTPDGREISLVLKDGGKSAIELLLFDISRVAGPKDTVLIYYAGHGSYEPQTGNAYWIPSDAIAQVPPTYVAMRPVTDNLKRLKANNVLLVADSCYAGAIRSGVIEGGEIGGKRAEVLKKMLNKRSRMLITSGNVEPVLDQGGQGHSIFARAFLTGLREMEVEAFSARELFNDYIYENVFGAAQQEPQNRPLPGAGHEGGGFVFVRNDG